MTDSLAQETWVTVAEGAEIVGYDRTSLAKAISRIAEKPEVEREIRIRKRSYATEIWLPDLIAYSQKPRTKPLGKRKSNG